MAPKRQNPIPTNNIHPTGQVGDYFTWNSGGPGPSFALGFRASAAKTSLFWGMMAPSGGHPHVELWASVFFLNYHRWASSLCALGILMLSSGHRFSVANCHRWASTPRLAFIILTVMRNRVGAALKHCMPPHFPNGVPPLGSIIQ